jgi:protein-S-isoprenylcysteine O-methyltransferase Ste14
MPRMARAVVFIGLSLALLLVFGADLRRRHAHSFYRFFAFELLLALVCLNAPAWFRDALAPRQVASWLALMLSMLLALHGFWLLRRVGRPAGPVENTTRLVTVGAYRYIRHPLYTSLACLGLGAFLKAPSWLGALLLLGVGVALLATARVEEAEMLRKFGAEYAAYMRRSKRFIPYVV